MIIRIGLFGATSSYDFGDYAMMIHNIEEIYRRNNSVKFFVFSLVESETEKLININIPSNIDMNSINVVSDYPFKYEKFLKRVRKLIKVLFKIDLRYYFYNYVYEKVKKDNYFFINSEFLKNISYLDICIFLGGGVIYKKIGVIKTLDL